MHLVRTSTKVFIVEGENRDLRFTEAITKLFIKGFENSIIINVPAAGNIYMLYEKLKADEFETDIIELLRENVEVARSRLSGIKRDEVDEVYLFFDADLHNNNVANSINSQDVLDDMLSVFNNETENGKLYISYPMVEALYDIINNGCSAFSKCYMPIENFVDYKTMSGKGNSIASRHFNSTGDWKMAIQSFFLRLKCLYGTSELTYNQYRQLVSPKSIFDLQKILINDNNLVFVLSALPELLLDYFREDFWKEYVDESKNIVISCSIKKLYRNK